MEISLMSTPFKWGSEFLVNTTTASYQYQPTITALADGRFVMAWTDGSQTGGDTSSSAIRAQLFNADGSPSGAEFLVNTTTADTQYEPKITALADGRFVVAWTDYSLTGGDTSSSAIRAQLFNADGSPSGAEFLVNTTTAVIQNEPTITALADGRFVVAWTDYSQTGGDTSSAIRAQVFNAEGSPSGAEFLVNTTTVGSQYQPTITALADGRFVVAWTDYSQTGGDTSGYSVRAQVFNADGSPSGAEFLVNTTTASTQINPTFTALADGRFVVAWQDSSLTGGDTSSTAIRAQVFNADGSPSGAEFLVNATTANTQFQPTITSLADGRFVVAWTDDSPTGGDTSSYAVRAQLFNADGSASGAEFLVNTTTTGDQAEPTITALADGRFVVAWNDVSLTGGDTSSYAVRAQIFDPRLTAVELFGSTLAEDYVGTAWNDRLWGGFGNDVLAGAAGSDLLYGEWGNDTLKGGGGNDRLYGGQGDDAQLGGAGGDELWGDVGNDTLNGGAGADAMIGGAGNDTYVVDTVADLVVENVGEGIDSLNATVSINLAAYANVENVALLGSGTINATGTNGVNRLTGNAGANTLLALGGNDLVNGGGGNDAIDGGTGNDVLDGSIGNDTLIGGTGLDTLYGGTGRDSLTGGADADVFAWRSTAEAGFGIGRDVVADFAVGVDQLDLSIIDAHALLANDQAFSFIGAAVFTGVAGQLRYVGGILQGDTNADGVADFQIQLVGSPVITIADMVL
jgi:RTX calcium-binding nonapeptide repeat (4 copies)